MTSYSRLNDHTQHCVRGVMISVGDHGVIAARYVFLLVLCLLYYNRMV